MMIPYIFVTKQEFINLFTCKLKLRFYIQGLIWYTFIFGFIFFFYYYNILLPLPQNISFLKNVYLYITSFIFLFLYIFNAIFVNLPQKKVVKTIDINFKNKIAFIITCHNSEDIIENTLINILKIFDPECIYIADNNKTNIPPNEKTKLICNKYKVNYFYIPIPNKAMALKTIINEVDKKYEYVIPLDDDTIVPEDFCPTEDFFLEDDRVAGVGYGIRVNNPKTLVERCVDLEYLLFCWSKFTQNKSTIEFMSGAAGMWKKDIFKIVINKNIVGKYIDFGEDGINGLIIRTNNYKMKQDFDNFFLTYTPNKLFFSLNEIFGTSNIAGFGATNLFKQRALRWYRSGTVKYPLDIITFFISDISNQKKNIFNRFISNIHYRLSLLFNSFILLTLIFASPSFILTLFYFFKKNNFDFELLIRLIIVKSMVYCITITYLLIQKIKFRNRKDLNIDFKIILIYPFFIYYSVILRIIGLISLIIYFIPFGIDFRYFKPIFVNFKKELNNLKNEKNENIEIIVKNDKEEIEIELR